MQQRTVDISLVPSFRLVGELLEAAVLDAVPVGGMRDGERCLEIERCSPARGAHLSKAPHPVNSVADMMRGVEGVEGDERKMKCVEGRRESEGDERFRMDHASVEVEAGEWRSTASRHGPLLLLSWGCSC